jgi:signal transduction histidine kinase
MSARPTLASRLVAPVVGLVLVAVVANVGFAAWWGATRAAAAAAERRQQVAAALATTRIPLAAPVLAALHQLTGDHYVVWDAATDAPGAATLPLGPADAPRLERGEISGSFVHDGTRYRVGAVRSAGVRPEVVLVLSPARGLVWTTLEAAWPELAVAAATLAVLVPLSLGTTRRLASRIGAIERHVGRITDGQFGHLLPEVAAADDPDEIALLVAGVNRMSGTLASQRDSLLAGERQRLLGQVAAGFAHGLRNAVTGARLAIDLHRRRCPAPPAGADESLAVATRQLDMLEEEVRGLLALGKPSTATPAEVDVGRLLADVGELVSPRASHAGVGIEAAAAVGLSVMGQHDALRAAVVNLALNGIDAAGAGGLVGLSAEADGAAVVLAVEDTGPGPAAAIRESMLEPFVTGKPEGIGLGLAVARTVAEAHGGRLEWSRIGERTRFAMVLPAQAGRGIDGR